MMKRIGWLALLLAGCATNEPREYHTRIVFERTGRDIVAERHITGARTGLPDANTVLGVGGAALSPAESFRPASTSSRTPGSSGAAGTMVGSVGSGSSTGAGSANPAVGSAVSNSRMPAGSGATTPANSSSAIGTGTVSPTGQGAGATSPSSTSSSTLTPSPNRPSGTP